MNPQITHFNNFFIKKGSHDTIHTFKNYFTTVFSVFSFQCVFVLSFCVYVLRFLRFSFFFFFLAALVDFLSVNSVFVHCSWTHKLHFSATFSLKMGPTILFTHLKIILLQCFQFSVFSFSKINSIQTHPKWFKWKRKWAFSVPWFDKWVWLRLCPAKFGVRLRC